jgi:hypothetical protein
MRKVLLALAAFATIGIAAPPLLRRLMLRP